MTHLDKQHPLPVYLQLKEMLQSQIEQGIYYSHQKLPSERDLCQHYNLSRMTARRALQELIAEGFAYTRAGKGTFVSYKSNSWTRQADHKTSAPRLTDVPLSSCQHNLVKELLAFNTVGVERAISEALAFCPLETLAFEVFPAIIHHLEQQWQNGKISLLVQNYAANTLRSQLIAMMNAATTPESGPKVLLACAPEDQHELGLLLLALSLRRRGFVVVYLGPNVTVSEFHQAIEIARPHLVCFSAATTRSVEILAELSHRCAVDLAGYNHSKKQDRVEPIFAFGGIIFNRNPELIERVSGLYLGKTIELGVAEIRRLLPPPKTDVSSS